MGKSRAIENLMQEHSAVLGALGVLGNMNRRLEKTGGLDAGDVVAFVEFLREFVDLCHHGKEELFLFPALERAGLDGHEELVRELLREHVIGRDLARSLEASAVPFVRADAFSMAARGYMDMIGTHIERESTELFPLAETILSERQLEELYQRFEEHEEQVVGKGRHEELHGLLGRLVSKYADG